MHGENMQTPCRKTPGRESNPGPSCCKATVLSTEPLCSPTLKYVAFFCFFSLLSSATSTLLAQTLVTVSTFFFKAYFDPNERDGNAKERSQKRGTERVTA
ncbi:hypothetical protein ILYODFUR_025279 [Ilyodon furcidens]|uniref:Uncharacterized protein n=1 Tax=Ilyodon furcidens TaxID=33524 RepID=A0ABV0VHM7_9TELE